MADKRRLTILLPPEDYQRLRERGEAYERTPDQEAAWLIRRALSGASIRQNTPKTAVAA